MIAQAQQKLPGNYRAYSDKYFVRTRQILEKEGLNPRVSMKVFTRGRGKVAGLEEALQIIDAYTDLRKTGEVWVTRDEYFKDNNPLMIIKGPVQSFVELETLYLGVLSHAISQANGLKTPDPKEIKQKLERLVNIYGAIPIIYFGARHYHWSLDKEIAKAAIEGGAVQTSTDIGSSNINKEGVGTTPHILTIVLASVYGIENATLKTAELFDKHMPQDIQRVTLVDTFNRELTDSLMVAEYFGKRKNIFRIDTCGENIGENGSTYQGKKAKDPKFKTGTGVTIELARNLRLNLIKHGFGDYTDTFLSSGFGNEAKAEAFVKAQQEFKKETGYDLFTGVGIGEVSEAKFCTADLFEVNGLPLSKTGREVVDFDYTTMKKVLGGE